MGCSLCRRIEGMIEQAKEALRVCKVEKKEVRTELELLELKLKANISDNTKTINLDQNEAIQQLRQKIEMEWEESVHLKKQITELALVITIE